MVRISSSTTWFMKRIFPLVWFGGLALGVVIVLSQGVAAQEPMLLLVPIGMAIFGYFVMRMLLFDLVDEVQDGGDFLRIRKGGHEERVAIGNIMNVSVSTSSPARITLRLITPARLGQEIVFIPTTRSTLSSLLSFKSFGKIPIAEDLMQRAHKARSRRG